VRSFPVGLRRRMLGQLLEPQALTRLARANRARPRTEAYPLALPLYRNWGEDFKLPVGRFSGSRARLAATAGEEPKGQSRVGAALDKGFFEEYFSSEWQKL